MVILAILVYAGFVQGAQIAAHIFVLGFIADIFIGAALGGASTDE